MDLSLYMRKNLDSSRGFIPLKDELEQIQSYVAIEKARFGEQVQVIIDVEPGCESWPIPSLIIQPLVENAIKHGIRERESGGTVTLTIYRNVDMLEVSVEDDGLGIPESTLNSLLARKDVESHSEGVGLRNSNHRLEQIYGPDFSMEITSTANTGTSIAFRIPAMEEFVPAASSL